MRDRFGMKVFSLMVPAMVWIDPKFMQINSWDNLGKLPFIPHFMEEQMGRVRSTDRDNIFEIKGMGIVGGGYKE